MSANSWLTPDLATLDLWPQAPPGPPSATPDAHAEPETSSTRPEAKCGPGKAYRTRSDKVRGKRWRAAQIAAGRCPSCGGERGASERVTCESCLAKDRAYRARERDIEAGRVSTKAPTSYVDEWRRPLRLAFTPRMLPVLGGERYDCELDSECTSELLRACGRQNPIGASCPQGCEHRVPLDLAGRLNHEAIRRRD